jgi:hypothetical protein
VGVCDSPYRDKKVVGVFVPFSCQLAGDKFNIFEDEKKQNKLL